MHAQLSKPANSCMLLITFGFYFSVLVSVWFEASVEKLLQRWSTSGACLEQFWSANEKHATESISVINSCQCVLRFHYFSHNLIYMKKVRKLRRTWIINSHKSKNNLKVMVYCDRKYRVPKILCANSERIFSKHVCHITANTYLVSAK